MKFESIIKPEEEYGVSALAEVFNNSPQTIRRWTDEDKLPCDRENGRRVFDGREVMEAIEESRFLRKKFRKAHGMSADNEGYVQKLESQVRELQEKNRKLKEKNEKLRGKMEEKNEKVLSLLETVVERQGDLEETVNNRLPEPEENGNEEGGEPAGIFSWFGS